MVRRIQRRQHAGILEVGVHGDQRPAGGGRVHEWLCRGWAAVGQSSCPGQLQLQAAARTPATISAKHWASLFEVLGRLHELQHAGKQGSRRGDVARLPLRRRQRVVQHYHLQA